ncbi:damage-control phosphatase ARMT1 family protein [Helicobacter burdigaliensis]|uniref:damage-control phosphatase ARMT1 family protein n=1 Tax=Helicobacter burdigaliensis TaxID=2315334 RepID=UPI000EF64B1B|nr:ARMT1-like domain-containing protein [Helicobacter burdigaliensis]
MNLTYECLECLKKQALSTFKITKNIEISISKIEEEIFGFLQEIKREEKLSKEFQENLILTQEDKQSLQKLLEEFYKAKKIKGDFEIPPTLLAPLVYQNIAKIMGDSSPYKQIKLQSIQKAREIKNQMLLKMPKSFEKEFLTLEEELDLLGFGLSLAVLGNVIDHGAQTHFDLESEAKGILELKFKKSQELLERLKVSKTLMYLADNAGENEFDEILIQIFKKINPHLEIFYLVRGSEIINDVTLEDLKVSNSNLFHLVNVLNSGVESPGFIYSLANEESKKLFRECDLILSKGMGNFESLEAFGQKDSKIFFLFKVKCNVVARHINKNLGEFALINYKRS